MSYREDLGPRLDFPWYFLVDRFVSRIGLEYRHPLLDRRVIEYCLGLPQDQLRCGSEAKKVLRNAMRGLLPETVRTRQDKAHYGTHTYIAALEDLGGEAFFDSLEIARLGWVNGERISKMFHLAASRFHSGDPSYGRQLYPLWMAANVELWYRAVFTRADELETEERVLEEVHA